MATTLSEDLHSLLSDPGRPPVWDLVIVGSGYGGAMAAAELSKLE
jgi:NADPH-dependent 2,4-dienoyl-CoA reductase/sulfur reductase-like enzyme